MTEKPSKFLIYSLLISLGLVACLLYKTTFPSDSIGEGLVVEGLSGINLWAVFLTGLITGGLTCLAVQGGLLAATIAQKQEQTLKDEVRKGRNAFPIITFLLTKLIAYTLLGFLLGLFGSVFQLSIKAQVVMQFAVAIFMIGTALNILNIHPIFRYFVIQPPRFLTRIVRKQSRNESLFAPALLGAFTVFIPCGTTQAMMALAIASGSPLLGSGVLFAFVLGTSPLFFILGYFATKMKESLHAKFMKLAAVALVLIALFNLRGAFALSGNAFLSPPNSQVQKVDSSSVVEEVTINFNPTFYSPDNLTVKAGSKVTLNLVNKNGNGCIQAFTIPRFGIQKIVRIGTSASIEFMAPEEPGQIPFMCSMGMYRGVINVI